MRQKERSNSYERIFRAINPYIVKNNKTIKNNINSLSYCSGYFKFRCNVKRPSVH